MEQELQSSIESFMKVYGKYGDQYMSDFFIDDQWNELPKEWRDYFDSNLEKATPISLSLLNPNYDLTDTTLPTGLIQLKQMITNIMGLFHSCYQYPVKIKPKDFSKVPRMLLTKIKKKKIHELEHLIALLENIHEEHSFEEVVDCGAGVGHLSRLLAYFMAGKDIQTSTIEGNEKFVETSLKLDQKFQKKLDFLNEGCNLPSRTAAYISNDKDFVETQYGPNKLLLGLHTCGDFAPTILRYFKKCPDAKILVNLGCCYHKLNGAKDMTHRQAYENDTGAVSNGFPISSWNQGPLSYAARESACHAQPQLVQDIMQNDKHLESFKINLFRAKLEYVIFKVTKSDANRHLGMKSVKFTKDLVFLDYLKQALTGYPLILSEILGILKDNNPEFEQLTQINPSDIPKLYIMYCLRLTIAPIIEILILTDRITYLKEAQIQAFICPLFNSLISPRCNAIIAFK
uniref:Methyltranfer_dom domain-containing protein n=1 Tax=Rhabditophanes sp. KR3021 TaxID=114890 RepID=A0AC35TWL9_9BILA